MRIKKKIVWMLVSCLMVLSLVMASCGPAAEEEKEVEVGKEEVEVGEEEVKVEEEEVVEEEEGLLPPEVPKYGGVLTLVGGGGGNWDYAKAMLMVSPMYMGEELIMGDWAKGPAGTGEASWKMGFGGFMNLDTGSLAESWEIPDDETVIYHIRPGVHFWNKPPTNGREFTAEDAAWNIDRHFSSRSSYLFFGYTIAGYNPTSIKVLDKYTLEIKVPPEMLGMVGLLVCGEYLWHISPDVVEQYGDMQDWQNWCGTGPFMLTDYVSDSSSTYVRNPNYWQYDPFHPDNRLPYLNGLKLLVIPDRSSQLAAMRTGKLDKMEELVWDEAGPLMEQCPEIKYVETLCDFPTDLWGRIDKEELPFKDVRVRRALNMAINKREIVEEYYSGKAELFVFPYLPLPEYKSIYIPLEEQSATVQELFTYNPEKAKKLLAEAGYPDGFETECVCSTTQADILSMIKNYLADIDVDMELKPLETGIYMSTVITRNFNEMIFASGKRSYPFRMLEVRKESAFAPSYYENPRTRECYEAVSRVVGVDDAEVSRLLKDIGPFMLEEAIGVHMPTPYFYTMWWPWVQNFHGEVNMGYYNPYQYICYIWYDEALRKSLGY